MAGPEQKRLQGTRVKRARKILDMSQGQLANRVSELIGEPISLNIISKIEKGERDIWASEMRALVTILHRSQEWLEGIEEDEWDRVKPGYRDRTPSARVNHSPLGLLTHTVPALAA